MTLVSTSGASFLSAPRVSTPFFFLVTERMRLFLSCHPQLSVIAPPRASPVDPNATYREHITIKQICEMGYTFIGPMIRNRADDKGTTTQWDFQGTSLYPFPMIIEVPEYPNSFQLNAA